MLFSVNIDLGKKKGKISFLPGACITEEAQAPDILQQSGNAMRLGVHTEYMIGSCRTYLSQSGIIPIKNALNSFHQGSLIT